MKIILTANLNVINKKLSGSLKDKAEIALEIFKIDLSDSRLRVHKLHGRFAEYWAFTVSYDCRIIFRYGKNNEIF